MFPIRDDNPTYHRTVVMYLIIIVNVIVWIFIQGLGFDPALTKSIFSFGLIPGELLKTIQPGTTIPIGEHISYVTTDTPNRLTLLTSMFMHGGWFHIIGNMWFLKVFGDNVEDSMGAFRFFIFYIFCGLAAAGAQIAFSPGSAIPMVGASGAISGVLGAYVMLYPKAPIHTLIFLGFFVTRIVVPAYLMLGYWFLLQLIGTAPKIGSGTGGVAFGAHVGGFVAGLVLIFFFKKRDRMKNRKAREVWKTWR
jgi:membrane associated rhomboid family serine protease